VSTARTGYRAGGYLAVREFYRELRMKDYYTLKFGELSKSFVNKTFLSSSGITITRLPELAHRSHGIAILLVTKNPRS